MNDSQLYSLSTLRLREERHVVLARQRARDLARMLGFDHQDQIRLATAASELARNAFRYAVNGCVHFQIQDSSPQLFLIRVTDEGPGIKHLNEIMNGQYSSKTGLGKGIIGTNRLMDRFTIEAPPSGTRVEAGKWLPPSAPRIDAKRAQSIAAQLASSELSDPFAEIERQNQELLKTLATLREKQEQLAQLNRELEDTNRGVVALYAELDQHADDLKRVSDLKTSFLSNLSHEFRTPLNSIVSLSRLLLNRSDGELSAEQEKQVTYIQRSASELSELVNDLLDLAKVEAGKTEVRAKYFEVRDVFGALRGVLKPLLVGNNLELIFEAEDEIPALYSDEGKISQVLRNLISNALKFTKQGYVRVTANLARGGSHVIFKVADTGIGIAPENLDRIFEEFVQVESELQSQSKGTGLGLPLSRRLAELLGGSLQVESELGVGSTFLFTIPIDSAMSRTRAAQEAPVEAPAVRPTILLIDDNREAAFIYESSLKGSGYTLVFAHAIREARMAMKRLDPALVVLDRLIDGKDCLSFIEELRSDGFRGPVLVVSVVDDAAAALDAGATAFLAKPAAPFALLSTVQELVEGTSAKTLLLVDDDEVARYLLGEALSKLGFRVLEARNGREAIGIIHQRPLDGVFLDIVMPGLDGFDVLKEIRANQGSRTMPVIIHSSKNLSPPELNLIAGMAVTQYPKQALATKESSDALLHALRMVGIER